MSLLERHVTIEQALHWGEHRYGEKLIRLAFGGRERVTVGEALDNRIGLRRVFGLCLRAKVLPEAVVHRVTIRLCRWFLERLRGRGVYIDFRSVLMLDAKERWVDGKISLGEMLGARRRAAEARDTVYELQDPLVDVAAHAAEKVGDPDPLESFLAVFSDITSLGPKEDESREIAEVIRRTLAEEEM